LSDNVRVFICSLDLVYFDYLVILVIRSQTLFKAIVARPSTYF